MAAVKKKIGQLKKKGRAAWHLAVEFIGFRLNGIAGFLIRSIVHGFVLKVLWDWYIVPTHILPRIDLCTSMGIYLMIAFAKRDYRPELQRKAKSFDYENDDVVMRMYGTMVIRALAVLIAGRIILMARPFLNFSF